MDGHGHDCLGWVDRYADQGAREAIRHTYTHHKRRMTPGSSDRRVPAILTLHTFDHGLPPSGTEEWSDLCI